MPKPKPLCLLLLCGLTALFALTASAAELPEGTPPEAEPVSQEIRLMGDTDVDGALTATDAREILRAVLSLVYMKPENAVYADANLNGAIDSADARMVLRAAVGLDSTEEHAFNDLYDLTPATCAEPGHVSVQCEDCGVTLKLALPRQPHTYTEQITAAPTCNAEGRKEFICTACGRSYTETLPRTAHVWVEGENGAKTCSICGAGANGWNQREGKYYYYDANGELVKNAIADNCYVDENGCYVNDPVIKAAVSFVQQYGGNGTNKERLRACYRQIVSYYKYKTIHGTPSAGSLPNTALALFNGRYGNCYSFASMFAYIGKVLGFPARIDSGKIQSVNGRMANHGWTELYIDGAWYMFDTVREKYYGVNAYMHTHDSFPAKHTHGTYFTLITQNGSAYWQ